MYIRLFFSHHSQLSPHVTFHNQPLSQLLNFFCLFLRLFFPSHLLLTLYPWSFFVFLNPSVHKSLWSVCLLNFICFSSLSPFSCNSLTPFYVIQSFLSCHSLFIPRCHSSLLSRCLSPSSPILYLSLYATSFPSFVFFEACTTAVCVCLHVHVIACVPKLYKSGILRKLKRGLKHVCDGWKRKSMLVRKYKFSVIFVVCVTDGIQ